MIKKLASWFFRNLSARIKGHQPCGKWKKQKRSPDLDSQMLKNQVK
jgi:hypothetical protein